jgi:hypothetical protein
MNGARIDIVVRQCLGNMQEMVRILIAVVEALFEINRAGIFHLDIKAEHIFVDCSQSDKIDVKFIDFGLSAVKGDDSVIHHTGDGVTDSTIFRSCESNPFRGNWAYASLFHHLGNPLDPASDLQSLLFLFHDITFGSLPWSGRSNSIEAPLIQYCLIKIKSLFNPSGHTESSWLSLARELVEHRAREGFSMELCFNLVKAGIYAHHDSPLLREISSTDKKRKTPEEKSPCSPARHAITSKSSMKSDSKVNQHTIDPVHDVTIQYQKSISDKLEDAFVKLLCSKTGISEDLITKGKRYGPQKTFSHGEDPKGKFELDIFAETSLDIRNQLDVNYGQSFQKIKCLCLELPSSDSLKATLFCEITGLYRFGALGDIVREHVMKKKFKQLERAIAYHLFSNQKPSNLEEVVLSALRIIVNPIDERLCILGIVFCGYIATKDSKEVDFLKALEESHTALPHLVALIACKRCFIHI